MLKKFLYNEKNKTARCDMKHFLEQAKEEASAYRPLPFWSWNDKLEEEELREQINRMHEIGMGGFFMHARGGLETDYLSDEWFSCIRACVDEAKKLGMEAWSYDENGWPSGFAGGKLLNREEFFLRGIICRKEDAFPVKQNDILAVYVIENDTARRIYSETDAAGPYDVIYEIVTPTYVDTLRRDVAEAFIEETHKKYKAEINRTDFGTVMPGFFTDEPQYSRPHTPYSLILEEEFKKAYGYDLFDNMVALFRECHGWREYRHDYYALCSRLFIENFMKPIYEWCEVNGCQLTGHGIEEKSLIGQVQCCGSIMPVYEYEHIPGIDCLHRFYGDDVMGRQIGSVCAQLGKKKALTETFALCGWDVSPRELKMIAETQYVHGVNLMCQHLYPYSERGQRKRDYPAHYSKHLPWQDSMKEFDRYFTNLGYLLSRGQEAARTLVIHPIHAAFSLYCQDDPRGSLEEINREFLSLVKELSAVGYPYHFGEESMLARHAHVEGAILCVGQCTYDRIIIPCVDTLEASTVSFLREYIEAGGKICFAGDKPNRIDARPNDEALAFLVPNMEIKDLFEEAPIHFTLPEGTPHNIRAMVRKTEPGMLIYIVNPSHAKYEDVRLHISGAHGVTGIDVDTLQEYTVYSEENGDGITLPLDFDEAQAYVFMTNDVPCQCNKPKKATKTIPLSNRFVLRKMPKNALTLDRFAEARGDAPFSELQPIERIRDNLLSNHYTGMLSLKCMFTVDEMPTSLTLAAEPTKDTHFYVNGVEIAMKTVPQFSKDLVATDILPLIRIGENEVVYTLPYHQHPAVYEALSSNMETMRNCLSFDTEIECLYLFGEFTVATEPKKWTGEPHDAWRYTGDFRICGQKKDIDLSNVVLSGYPFYAGTLHAETTFVYHKGDTTVLEIRGRYATCGVTVNGQDVGTLLFEHTVDIAPYLVEGENNLMLSLTNGCRNLLGPHHSKEAEPYSVGPNTFSFEKGWRDGECPWFDYRYAFVRFGLDF